MLKYIALESHPQDSRVKINPLGINQPLSANMCHDPSNGGLVLALENHPNDSRIKIREDNICQTLSSRMGTGGGNVPLLIEVNDESDSVGCAEILIKEEHEDICCGHVQSDNGRGNDAINS